MRDHIKLINVLKKKETMGIKVGRENPVTTDLVNVLEEQRVRRVAERERKDAAKKAAEEAAAAKDAAKAKKDSEKARRKAERSSAKVEKKSSSAKTVAAGKAVEGVDDDENDGGYEQGL